MKALIDATFLPSSSLQMNRKNKKQKQFVNMMSTSVIYLIREIEGGIKINTYWTSSSMTSSVSDILLWMSSAKWIPISLFLEQQIYLNIKQPGGGWDSHSLHCLQWVSALTQISGVTVVENQIWDFKMWQKGHKTIICLKLKSCI